MENTTKTSTTVMIVSGEYGQRNKPVELTGAHFEAVVMKHRDNGLTASVVYSEKGGKILGHSQIDCDAAEAMILGMKALPHVWTIDSEYGSHLGYGTECTNIITGRQVSIYR